MIKAVFFDFGNVIYLADQMIAYEKFAQFSPYSKKEIHKKIYFDGIEKLIDEGKDFKEFYEKSTHAIKSNKKLTKEKFKDIWCDIFLDNPNVEYVLKSIKPEIKMYLVSNTNKLHWETTISKLPLIKKYFGNENQQILSYQVGKRKPNNLMYQIACYKASCLPGETIFIDDNHNFVKSFEEFGGNALRYNGKYTTISYLYHKLKHKNIIKKDFI